LHRLRSWQEAVKGLEKRMSYYSPYHLNEEMKRFSLREAQIHWLATPPSFQSWFSGGRKDGSYLLSRLFGYAFLVLARNQP
jgi:hypothetical protein